MSEEQTEVPMEGVEESGAFFLSQQALHSSSSADPHLMQNIIQSSNAQDSSSVISTQPTSIKKQDLFKTGHDDKQILHSSSSDNHQMIQNSQLSDDYDDKHTVGDERPQSSESQDIAKFKIKVDEKGPFSKRWKVTLQKALQTWLSSLKGKSSIQSFTFMGDESCAEVQITPSKALEEVIKKQTATLVLKDKEDKEVTAHIFLDDAHSVTVPQTSILEDNVSSPKVNSSIPVTYAVSEDTNKSEDVAAANRAPNHAETTKTAEMTPETPAFPVPLYQYWYMHHAYRKELEQIKKQNGVSIIAEVSVLIKPTQSSSPDSVAKASEDFQTLVKGCVNSFNDAAINHNAIDSDIVKETLHRIRSEKEKMMFTMSSSDCLFFGPKKFTDMIKRETNEMDVDKVAPQSRFSLDMDAKELPTQLEMDKVHWDLMNLSYKEQLSQLETKYGVSFNEEKLQKNVIKVQARSKGVQLINLESHALRALTQLYQKLASATVSCKLTNPTDKTDVTPLLEKLQQQHYCVVAADGFSPWKLVGLPEHLGPVIADIEKTLQKNVFDDKMKKFIGYSGDIPYAREINWNQMPDYGAGAVGGAVRDETGNFRRRSEADTGFNEDSEGNSRHDSKGPHAEEETCTICMDSFTNKKKLKCGHEFCQECINMSVKSLGPICPVCKEVFGKMEGNQPDGTMHTTKNRLNLPGYPGCGTIEIIYSIPSGIQTEKHPNPGQPFYGANRRAYLPDNDEGKKVLALLEKAFKQKLIFTVGKSTTSGLDNVVTWNDVHHKTNKNGGPESYGYPDPDYLKRVKDELKAKGIE